MNNLYSLTDKERHRILNLHESLKPKYIINEQVATNVMTDNDLMGDTNVFRSFVQNLNDFNVLFKPLGLSPVDFLAGRRIGVKGVVDALDGWVDEKDLGYVLNVLNGLKGKCYSDNTKKPAVLIPAMKRFIELYKKDEGAELSDDVSSVGTLKDATIKLKEQILNVIKSYSAQSCAPTQINTVEKEKEKEKEKVKRNTGNQQELISRLKQSQKSLGLPESGKLDVTSLQSMLTKLSGEPSSPAANTANVQEVPTSSVNIQQMTDVLNKLINKPQ